MGGCKTPFKPPLLDPPPLDSRPYTPEVPPGDLLAYPYPPRSSYPRTPAFRWPATAESSAFLLGCLNTSYCRRVTPTTTVCRTSRCFVPEWIEALRSGSFHS